MLLLPHKELSYWKASAADSTIYPKLNQRLEVDVVIVGGGICGLTCAYLLKQSGKSVAVLEKNTIGSGTTGNTTGKVTSQHNLFYRDLASQLGEAVAQNYGQANQAALGKIQKIIENENINCGWQRQDHYIYTTHKDQTKKFKQEAKIAASIGLPASFEKETPLPFGVAAAVRFTDQGYFNAQAYVDGLAAAVNGGGSYVFEKSKATSFRDGSTAIVGTSQAEVIADDIIVATNVPAFPLLARGAYCILEYPETSYIVAAPIEQKIDGMYISPDDDNFSLLPVSGKQDLLLIGGRGHVRGPHNKNKRWQELADYGQDKFGVTSIKYKWAAWDYMAYDNIPLVGKMYPWSKHLYVATAFKKWGLTNTMVAATILTDTINGKDNLWASTFSSLRTSPIKSIPRVMRQHLPV
jgi:glycine/D-amino acid oxidase-like deaminating enzyme